MPLQVPCPNCGAKLKAPDTAAGKKVKCKQCGQGFRLPGVPVAESVGDDDIPVADFVEDAPAPAPPPAKNVAALPSADPFDFGKAGAKAAVPAAKPAKPAAPVPAAAPRPAFGAAKAEAPKAEATPNAPPVASKPVAPAPPAAKPAPAPTAKAAAPAAPAPSKPAAETAKPAKPAKSEEAAAPAAKPAKQPEPSPPPAPAADPFAFDQPDAGGGDDMFAFGDEPAAKPSKSRRRYDRDDEDEEDDRTAKAKKRRDEDDEDEAPRKKKSRDEEDEEEDERPAKSKSKSKGSEESYNPFSDFPADTEPEAEKSKRRRDEDDDDRRDRKKRGDGDEDEDEKPHYRRPDERPASKMLLYVGVFGAVSLLLGVLALTMYVKNVRQQKREAEEAAAKKLAEEKAKEEPPPSVPPDPGKPAVPPDPKPKDKVETPVGPKPKDKTETPAPKPKDKVDTPDPKPKDKVDTPVDAVRPKDPGPAGNTISFQGLTPIAVGTLPAKPTQADGPRAGGPIDFPLATVKRIFPPFEKNADTCVLVQVAPPVGGKGEKLALESYGPNGNRVGGDRIDYDGDGLDPIADARASTEGRFFLAAPNGKLHVWSMNEKKKLADGIDPYAGTPHEKEGLAAAYLTASPNVVILVSTAGAVQSYDLVNRKIVKDFVPPKGAPGRVAMDKSVAKANGNGSIVVAVGGVVYQLEANEGLKEIRKHDLTGDVSRSLALAVSATPGRFLYVFETVDKGGKKEIVVMGVPINDPTKRFAYRAPAALGEPKGALWAGDEFGGVIFKEGIVWFNDHDNRFFPLLYTVPPAMGPAAGDDKALWFVVPHSKQANRSVVVSLGFPLDGFEDYQENFAKKQPLRAVRIDASGLSK